MEYKKFILFMNNENKHYFKENPISDEELIKIKNFFIVQKNNMENPQKLFYIEPLKPINPDRSGSVNMFHRFIFFEEKDRKIAKKEIINNFNFVIAGRSKETLKNLGYITEENLKFFNDIKIEKKEKVEEKIEKKEKIQKKRGTNK